MRKTLLAIAAIIFIALFAACKTSSVPPDYSMSANVYANFIFVTDTLPFATSAATNVFAVDSAGMCRIYGLEYVTNNQTGAYQNAEFLLFVKYYTGPGTYTINDSTVTVNYGYSSPNIYLQEASLSSGQLTINVSGETVSGTFSGGQTGGFQVTEGKFIASGSGF